MEMGDRRDVRKVGRKSKNSGDEWLATKSRKLAYKLCLHCNKELNIKIYNEHKRLYYDASKRSWNQDVVMISDNEEASSEFSSLSEADYGGRNEDHNKPVITSSDEDFSDAEAEYHHPVASDLPLICEPQQDRLEGIIFIHLRH